MTQPAGKGPQLDFRFRNGTRVDFEAHEILVPKLLDDVKAYLEIRPQAARLAAARPRQHRLPARRPEPDSSTSAARSPRWGLDLKPLPGHFDDRVTVATPLQKAGAYLVTAKLADGNTSRIVVWVADTVILKKPMADSAYLLRRRRRHRPARPARRTSSSSATGCEHVKDNEFRVETRNFAEFTDADGQVIPGKQETQRLPVGRHRPDRRGPVRPPGLLEHLAPRPSGPAIQPGEGLHDHRPAGLPAQAAGQVQGLGPPRPLRPGRRLGVRRQVVHRRDPQPQGGEGLHEKTFKADAFGGFDGEFPLPADATLGVYQVLVTPDGQMQGGTFRVEEYKKPEFEVSVDAPTGPVMLGEKVKATIKAKYYFGAPVAEAKVKYKVTRTAVHRAVVSARPPGTGSTAPATGGSPTITTWYPGWSRWGVPRPIAWWWGVAAAAARGRRRGRGADRRRRHARRRDRHRAGQGDARRQGPQVPDHRRGRRPVAADDRRHGRGAGRPQAVQGLSPGSTAATTAPATRSAPTPRPGRSTASRSRARGRSSS